MNNQEYKEEEYISTPPVAGTTIYYVSVLAE